MEHSKRMERRSGARSSCSSWFVPHLPVPTVRACGSLSCSHPNRWRSERMWSVCERHPRDPELTMAEQMSTCLFRSVGLMVHSLPNKITFDSKEALFLLSKLGESEWTMWMNGMNKRKRSECSERRMNMGMNVRASLFVPVLVRLVSFLRFVRSLTLLLPHYLHSIPFVHLDYSMNGYDQ